MTSKNGKKEGWIEVLLEDCVAILDSREYLLMQERELKELKVKVEASSILIMEQLEK